MRIKIIPLLLTALLCSVAAQSRQLSIESTSGKLSSLITNPGDITDLTVSGNLDIRDFEYIAKEMPKLQALNLASVSITSLQNYRNLQSSQQSFAAHELPSLIFMGMPLQKVVLPVKLQTISAGALANTQITSIEIPASVREIDAAAFQGCEKLQSVTIPAGVSTFGENIFDGCIALKSATWNAATLPNRAFADCVSLNKVSLGADVRSIGNEAFSGCSELSTVEGFGTTFRSIGDRAFWGTGITEIDISASTWMSEIGEGAFGHCTKLEKVFLPEAVSEIGASAFLSDNSLTELAGAQSPLTIPTAMLMNASALKGEKVLGRYAQEVESYALYNTASIDTLFLPEDLKSIGDYAFSGMESLQTMKGSNLKQVPELGTDVWGDLNRSDITLIANANMADEFKSTPVWQDFKMEIGQPDGSGGIISLDPAKIYNRGLNVEFRGDILYVSTTDDNTLGRVTLYDVSGRLLAVVNAKNNDAEFDTRRWPSTNIFIVNTTSGNVKIARNH